MTSVNDKENGRETQHPGHRRLEQYAFASDDTLILDEVKTHVEQCAECRHRVDEMRTKREAFLSAMPPEVFADQIASRSTDTFFNRCAGACLRPSRLIPVAASLVIAVGLGLYFLSPTHRQTDDMISLPDNQIAFKGNDDVQLNLYVSRHKEPAVPYEPGLSLSEGDVLKFGVQSKASGFLTIAYMDDKGTLSIYYPRDSQTNNRIAGGKLNIVDTSITLDSFVGTELIVAVVTKTQASVDNVRRALQKAYDNVGGQLEKIETLDVQGEFALQRIVKK